MGAIYSQALEIPPSNFVTAFPLCEIVCTATDHVALLEVFANVYVNAAATIVLGFGRPASSGVTPILAPVFVAEDGGNSAGIWLSIATRWALPPTAPTVFSRRQTLNAPNTGGGQAWWKFPDGFVIVPGASAVVWCITGTTTAGNVKGDVAVVVDD